MKIFFSTVILLGIFVLNANAQDVCNLLNGATLIAQDEKNSYLGKINSQSSSDSIFNEYGTYGSEYSSESIWNEYGNFGGEYSNNSPHNEFTSTPPMIIKDGKIIGYLSANKSITSSITPNLLKALCQEQF